MDPLESHSQEQSGQLREILKNLQDQIDHLPALYQQPLASEIRRLSACLGGDRSPESPANENTANEPAYIFGQDLPSSMIRQMEMVLNSLDSAIFVFDKEGIIRRTNACARAMLGFNLLGMSREEFYRHFQVYDPQRQPLSLEQMPDSRASAGAREAVTREALEVSLPNGRSFSILASAIPVHLNNEYTGVVSTWNDMTELKRLTSQVEAERDQFKTILESISDEVWYSDQDWRVRLMNEKAGRNLGFESPEEINRLPNEAMLEKVEIFYPDGTPRPLEQTPLLRSLKGEAARGQEIVRNKQNGQTMYREYTSAPIRSRDNRVVGAVSVIRDITQQKRQERSLRDSEAALRKSVESERARAAELNAVMEAVPAVIFVTHDPQARIVTGNHSAHQLLRVEPGYNFSRTAYNEQPPIHYRVFKQGRELQADELPLETCAATGQPVRGIEEDILFEDGSQVHLLGNVTPLFDEAGQRAGAVAAYVDITERVKAEQALRESEERFRSVLENSRDMIYRYNLETHNFDFISPMVEQTLGWSLDEALNTSFEQALSHIHPQDRDALQTSLKSVAAAGKGELEYRFQRKDGQYHWLADRITVVKDLQGRPLFFSGVVRNVTDQKEAEARQLEIAEELRESEQRFRVALASAPITVFTMDRNLRYTWIYNQGGSADNLTAIPDKHALGKRDDELFPPEDVEELMEVKWSVIATGQPVQQEVMVRVKDEWSTFVITLDPLLNAAGEVTGLTGSALDVTRQRRLEMENLEHMTQMEIQRRLLESREQERQEIARELHDGPIQLLSSTLFNLQTSKSSAPTPQVMADYEQLGAGVKSAVQELRAIVNELRPPATIRFGLAKAIRIHAEEFNEKHPEPMVELDLTDDQDRLPGRVRLNLFRIYQEALQNILRHAQAKQAWVRFRLEEDQAMLEIRDNGKGFIISGHLIDQALNGHYGLVGISERAEAIDGKLEIKSLPGEGTLIRVNVRGGY